MIPNIFVGTVRKNLTAPKVCILLVQHHRTLISSRQVLQHHRKVQEQEGGKGMVSSVIVRSQIEKN
jgi:hypothetical protein